MPNDWNSYKPDFDRTLKQLPQSREAITGAAESFGRHVGEKAKALDMPADEIVNSVRSGLSQYAPQPTGQRST